MKTKVEPWILNQFVQCLVNSPQKEFVSKEVKSKVKLEVSEVRRERERESVCVCV